MNTYKEVFGQKERIPMARQREITVRVHDNVTKSTLEFCVARLISDMAELDSIRAEAHAKLDAALDKIRVGK